MAVRIIPLVTDEIYHIFNRSIARQPIFLKQSDYLRMYSLIDYYRFVKPTLRFSHYNRLEVDKKQEFINNLYISYPQNISIFAFCIMPNHFHLLVKQLVDGGIGKFTANIQNSYAKYLNLSTERTGSVFQAMFKVVRIETDEQLLHVSRYIHLNPVTSYLLKNISLLKTYKWTSYIDYLGKRSNFVNTKPIFDLFGTLNKFKEFTTNQVDYQRKLAEIKHLALE